MAEGTKFSCIFCDHKFLTLEARRDHQAFSHEAIFVNPLRLMRAPPTNENVPCAILLSSGESDKVVMNVYKDGNRHMLVPVTNKRLRDTVCGKLEADLLLNQSAVDAFMKKRGYTGRVYTYVATFDPTIIGQNFSGEFDTCFQMEAQRTKINLFKAASFNFYCHNLNECF